MDALRREIEQNDFKNSTISWMNVLMKEKVKGKNMLFLDLTDAFKADFDKNKISFASKIDSHWNDYGHQKVVDALYPFLVKEKVIQ